MYTPNIDYFKWLMQLAAKYNIDTTDIDALSLVGFNMHVLADINDTVNFNSRDAIRESNVITANKLDSLYKHAREVDLFPTLSIPAEMNFILVIPSDEFDRVAESSDKYKAYTITKTNYVKVGDFIYSLDYDIEIIAEITDDPAIQGYVQAKYIIDDQLPDVLNDHINPVIKVAKRKTVRGWEYQLYVRLKQYAREIKEMTFTDRDYNAFNYSASGELVTVKSFRHTNFPKPHVSELAVKLYFENSRTSKDSIFMQFESPNTFSLIHKSQESGLRAIVGDKLETHVYTTAGSAGNFRYARQTGDGIEFVTDSDTDVNINVWIPDGKSEGGASYVNDKEVLRTEIITRKSTRDIIVTENDLLMTINDIAAEQRISNAHYTIKYRNDIRKIFNVFTTLILKTNSDSTYYIPTNTSDITWDTSVAASRDEIIGDSGKEVYYNLNSFIATVDSVAAIPNISPTSVQNLIPPLMEEFRLGISEPQFITSTDPSGEEVTSVVISPDTDPIPVVTSTTKTLVKGKEYFYDNRLFKATTSIGQDEKLEDGVILNTLQTNTANTKLSDSNWFVPDKTLTYWLPYYLVYVYSETKNFIIAYDQVKNTKYDLDYNLDKPYAPYSFICNWVKFYKPSVFNEYSININVRNNLTNISLKENGVLLDLDDGSVVDVNKLQVFFILTDQNGVDVFVDKFTVAEYNNVPEQDDDYLDYALTLLPAGYIPKIINNQITLWSSLNEAWVRVPVTGLKATIKIFNIDETEALEVNPENDKKDPSIARYRNVEVPGLKDAEKDNNGNPIPTPVAIYYDVDYRSDRYLVNHYTTDCDILNDSTANFKLQHSIIGSKTVNGNVYPIIRILQAPMVQYTFYKHFSSLYQSAIEQEKKIFDTILKDQRYQGEFSMALKFSNTYGFSQSYTIGKEGLTMLDNVQLNLEFLISTPRDIYIDYDKLSYQVAKYLESIKFERYEKFHISKLYDYIYSIYGTDTIDYIEYIDANGLTTDNQLIQMKTNEINNTTIIEKLNIPYTYDGEFKYSIKWKKYHRNQRTKGNKS